METVEQPRPPGSLTEYRVFLLESIQPSARDWRLALAGTVVVHLLVLALLLSLPHQTPEPVVERIRKPRFTPLIDPPTRLTQKALNKAPIAEVLSAGLVLPSPAVQRPQPEPTRKFSAPPPPQTAAQKRPSPALPQEPPKIVSPQQTTQLTTPAIVPPPVTRTIDPPKLTLENVAPPPTLTGQGDGRLKVPGGGVQEAVKEAIRSGPTGRSIGDDTSDAGAFTLNNTPSPTRPKMNLELQSDPQGIDFKPYLTQVLQNVRRNWFAVMPESARLGQRGRVVVQFAIARDGKIVKVVLSSESNVRAFDRAAVAALSASDPLPQLPPDFKGDRVILQFTFMYNSPR